MSSPERARSADANAQALADGLAQVAKEGPQALSPETVQALVALGCRAYAAHAEAGRAYPIVSAREALTSTDVMIACSALLKAADLQVFELGMWSSWTGR